MSTRRWTLRPPFTAVSAFALRASKGQIPKASHVRRRIKKQKKTKKKCQITPTPTCSKQYIVVYVIVYLSGRMGSWSAWSVAHALRADRFLIYTIAYVAGGKPGNLHDLLCSRTCVLGCICTLADPACSKVQVRIPDDLDRDLSVRFPKNVLRKCF